MHRFISLLATGAVAVALLSPSLASALFTDNLTLPKDKMAIMAPARAKKHMPKDKGAMEIMMKNGLSIKRTSRRETIMMKLQSLQMMQKYQMPTNQYFMQQSSASSAMSASSSSAMSSASSN